MIWFVTVRLTFITIHTIFWTSSDMFENCNNSYHNIVLRGCVRNLVQKFKFTKVGTVIFRFGERRFLSRHLLEIVMTDSNIYYIPSLLIRYLFFVTIVLGLLTSFVEWFQTKALVISTDQKITSKEVLIIKPRISFCLLQQNAIVESNKRSTVCSFYWLHRKKHDWYFSSKYENWRNSLLKRITMHESIVPLQSLKVIFIALFVNPKSLK